MDLLFYKLPQDLCRSSGFVSKVTGEFIPLSSSAKIIYSYMLARNKFFITTRKGEHFETQSTIGDACGVEYRTVLRVMKDFLTHGIIVAEKQKSGGSGYTRYFYKSVSTDLVLWVGKKTSPTILNEKPVDNVSDKVQNTQTDCEYTDEFLSGIIWE